MYCPSVETLAVVTVPVNVGLFRPALATRSDTFTGSESDPPASYVILSAFYVP